jgi:hypothetical protein
VDGNLNPIKGKGGPRPIKIPELFGKGKTNSRNDNLQNANTISNMLNNANQGPGPKFPNQNAAMPKGINAKKNPLGNIDNVNSGQQTVGSPNTNNNQQTQGSPNTNNAKASGSPSTNQQAPGLPSMNQQGSILRNTASADKFSEKFLASILG